MDFAQRITTAYEGFLQDLGALLKKNPRVYDLKVNRTPAVAFLEFKYNTLADLEVEFVVSMALANENKAWVHAIVKDPSLPRPVDTTWTEFLGLLTPLKVMNLISAKYFQEDMPRRAEETVRVNGFAWTLHNEELYSIKVMLPSEQDENKMIKTLILVHPHHRRTQDWVVSSRAGGLTEALVDRDLKDGPFKTPEAAMKAVGDYLHIVTR